MSAREPLCKALLLCDRVHTDPMTNKKFIMGTLHELYSRGFPLNMSGISVYLAITECEGDQHLILRVIDVNEELDPIFEAKINFPCKSPLDVIELGVPIPKMIIPAAGDYRVQLTTLDGTPIMERRLLVRQRGSKAKSMPE